MAGSARPTISRQADDKRIYHGRRDALRFPALRSPSGWVEDSHLQAALPGRHTCKGDPAGRPYVRPPSLGEHKVRPYGKNIHLIAN